MARGGDPERLGDPVGNLLRLVGRDRGFSLFDVWRAWNRIVGDAIAKRAQPNGLRDGVLFVVVDSHTWMQELQLMKGRLRADLNRTIGAEAILDLQFLAGSIEAPAPAQPTGNRSQAEVELANSKPCDMPQLKDPELAHAFEHLMAARARRASAARAQSARAKTKRRS